MMQLMAPGFDIIYTCNARLQLRTIQYAAPNAAYILHYFRGFGYIIDYIHRSMFHKWRIGKLYRISQSL